MNNFADLAEHEATGRIADIYDEIRLYGAVPYVSSLQRQLATIPGCLEWLWDAVRPAFIDGSVPRAAWGAIKNLDLPSVPLVPRPALRVLGVDLAGETELQSIYETFLRASPVNMVTASLMTHFLGCVTSRVSTDRFEFPTWEPPLPPQTKLAFPLENELGEEGQKLLSLFAVDLDGASFVPGLYQLLARWPQYLAHIAVEIGPLFKCPDVVEICSEIVARVDAVVPPLVEGLSAGPKPFDSDTAKKLRRSLRIYRGQTSPQMIVFSTILRDALPAPFST